ncbi:TRAP transporter small permease subunit [Alteribacillus iranensis]|uniref:TRAP-type C4-dicarboxylate transport system, small permease component n=1 Tax=Alteribacillus iranensis TaxID=930128 RepID=A0A1I2E3F7_9BACI|nr:TRAP transporter small permease [Alteribacillus iranensis]SFE87166.1 TRAP-type C4-dicarboxylate transport system, small permease component [Alteribacillus iranensis]
MEAEQNKKPIWARVIDGISEISGYLGGIAIFASTLIIVYQVIVRSFFNVPTVWQTELSIYLLMFATFVGATYGLKHNSHVGVDVIIERLPKRGQSILRIFTSLLCVIFTVVLSWKAWELWWEVTENGWHSSTLWGPPLTFPYFILPLGMTFVTLQFIVLIYEEFVKLKNINQT